MKISYHQTGGFLKCKADHVTLPMAGNTEMGWGIHPSGLQTVLKNIKDRYGNIPLIISENGCAAHDIPDENGFVDDQERINYLNLHLQSAWKAIQSGINLEGYFVWSLLDNFEWAQGYQPRFGLVSVDYSTLDRIPKQSFYWYKSLIANDGR
jgi:beta-glucosidase